MTARSVLLRVWSLLLWPSDALNRATHEHRDSHVSIAWTRRNA